MDLEEAAVVVEASQEVPTVILTSADVLLLLPALGRLGMLASSFPFSALCNSPTGALAVTATSR